MDKEEFSRFMKDQVLEIEKELKKKKIKDVAVKKKFIYDWISKQSAIFRQKWTKEHGG